MRPSGIYRLYVNLKLPFDRANSGPSAVSLLVDGMGVVKLIYHDAKVCIFAAVGCLLSS